jgi:hypothetical protein
VGRVWRKKAAHIIAARKERERERERERGQEQSITFKDTAQGPLLPLLKVSTTSQNNIINWEPSIQDVSL